MKKFDEISPEHQKFLINVGKELKLLRTLMGKSYIQLAEDIGISRNTYNLMENGKINFQFTTLLQVIDYYGYSLLDFFLFIPKD